MTRRAYLKMAVFCGFGMYWFQGCGLTIPGGGGGCLFAQNPPLPGKTLSLSLIATHDPDSPSYNGDCITCHGNREDLRGLDGRTRSGHGTMTDIFGATGNDHCKSCHGDGPDFLTSSAGALRKQVDPRICAVCHGPNSEVPLYLTTGN